MTLLLTKEYDNESKKVIIPTFYEGEHINVEGAEELKIYKKINLFEIMFILNEFLSNI